MSDSQTYLSYETGIYELRGAAGAGKTFQLTQDIMQLAAQRKSVAVISFSNAAVNELNSRVNDINICLLTIHSFSWKMISPIAAKLFFTLNKKGYFNLDCLQEIPINQISDIKYGELGIQFYNKDTHVLWLSHDDVIKLFTTALCFLPKFSDLVSNSFDFILVDEYQDTNMEFLSAICNCVAKNSVIGLYGDPFQSIYLETRNSSIKSILNEFNVHQFKLNYNYRSDKQLVNIFNISRISYDNVLQIPKINNVTRKPKIFSGDSSLSKEKLNAINRDMEFKESVVLSSTNLLRMEPVGFKNIASSLRNCFNTSSKMKWEEVLNTHQLNPRIQGLINYSHIFFGSDYVQLASLKQIFTFTSIQKVSLKAISTCIINQKKIGYNDFQAFLNLGLVMEDQYMILSDLFSKITYTELNDITDFYNNLEKINNKSLTIYASKGLEFDNVILNIDYGFYYDRNWNDINFNHKESDSFNPQCDAMSYLFYVGITRAKYGLAIYINNRAHPNFLNKLKYKFPGDIFDYDNF